MPEINRKGAESHHVPKCNAHFGAHEMNFPDEKRRCFLLSSTEKILVQTINNTLATAASGDVSLG